MIWLWPERKWVQLPTRQRVPYLLHNVQTSLGPTQSRFQCVPKYPPSSGVPRNFVRGCSTNSVEDRGQRERGSGDASPLVRGSGGSCYFGTRNFISCSKLFLIFGTLRLFMITTNLFVIANVKQLRIDGSFRILLPFFRTSCGVDILNSAIFNSFHNRVEFGTILEGLRNFGGEGAWTPLKPPPVRHCPLLPGNQEATAYTYTYVQYRDSECGGAIQSRPLYASLKWRGINLRLNIICSNTQLIAQNTFLERGALTETALNGVILKLRT